MPKYKLYTGKKERKVISFTDCKLKYFSSQIYPPPPPEYGPIKFVLCPYIRPGHINGILRYRSNNKAVFLHLMITTACAHALKCATGFMRAKVTHTTLVCDAFS